MAAHVHSYNTIVTAKGRNPGAKPLGVRHRAMQHKDGRGARPRVGKVVYEEIKFQSFPLKRMLHAIPSIHLYAGALDNCAPAVNHGRNLCIMLTG